MTGRMTLGVTMLALQRAWSGPRVVEFPTPRAAGRGRAAGEGPPPMSRASERGAGLESVPRALVLALRRLLRPLVRLLLEHRLPFTYVSELLKGAYVEV